jgi:hypothetical protein
MGNRVLLFSVDSIPEPGRQPDPIRALSEFNGGASLVQDLLVSGSPRRCQSVVWPEHRIGIAGDYDAGVQRLWNFLDALGKLGSLPGDQGFQDAVAQARQVLSSPKHRGRQLREGIDPGHRSGQRHADRRRAAATLAGAPAELLARRAGALLDRRALLFAGARGLSHP